MIAVAYSRISPRPGVEESKSIEKQIAKCRAFCEFKDYDLIAVFEENGDKLQGVSGASMANRPKLKEALDLVCKHKGVLVVFSLSRLARNTKDAITITERLDKAGANLVSLSEMLDTSTAMGRAFFRISAVFAELERDLTSERTSVAMKFKQASGKKMSKMCPYGLKDDPDKLGYMIECEAEQSILKGMSLLKGQGMGYSEISRQLASEGFMQRNGKPFHHNTISRLLRR